MNELPRFNLLDYLQDEELATEYLKVALEENNPQKTAQAIKNISQAQQLIDVDTQLFHLLIPFRRIFLSLYAESF